MKNFAINILKNNNKRLCVSESTLMENLVNRQIWQFLTKSAKASIDMFSVDDSGGWCFFCSFAGISTQICLRFAKCIVEKKRCSIVQVVARLATTNSCKQTANQKWHNESNAIYSLQVAFIFFTSSQFFPKVAALLPHFCIFFIGFANFDSPHNLGPFARAH